MPFPVNLVGPRVRLEPLAVRHIVALTAASSGDRSGYAYTPVPHGLEPTHVYVIAALRAQQSGEALPFAVVRPSDNLVVGSTRFLELDYWQGPVALPPAPRGPVGDQLFAISDAVEIGATWLNSDVQETGVNAEAKWLMLRHAFDCWGVQRVSLRADARLRSRAAIEKLGVTLDGLHRAHTRGLDGEVRNGLPLPVARGVADGAGTAGAAGERARGFRAPARLPPLRTGAHVSRIGCRPENRW